MKVRWFIIDLLKLSSAVLSSKLNTSALVNSKLLPSSSACASTLALTSYEDSTEAFKACTSENAYVVSEIFCLPTDYRKDVPPPGKNSIKKTYNMC